MAWYIILFIVIGVVIFVGPIVWFIIQKRGPEQTAKVKVVGTRKIDGFPHVTVEFEDGTRRELFNWGRNAVLLAKGDVGELTYKGRFVKGFANAKEQKAQAFCQHCGSILERGATACDACGARRRKSA